MSDNVNHPSHYTQGRFEVIDVIEDSLTNDGFEGYCVGNIMKYVMRYRHKNGLEDLKKARWYLGRLIECVGESEQQATRSQLGPF